MREFHKPTGVEDPKGIHVAKWVFKWAKNDDDTPRAKAILVLQGFNNPHALDGSVPMAVPAASRVALQLAMLLAEQMTGTSGRQTSLLPFCKDDPESVSYARRCPRTRQSSWASTRTP